ncbi:MAG: hypothetical protein H0W83_07320, partial [Planctomycetes bacterium]|nr:hypothetical protein [Planctomycetota bacterium]
TDPGYNNLVVTDISVTNVDDDVAAVSISKSTVAVSESGGSDTYTVNLTTVPAFPVTISFITGDGQCQVDTDAGTFGFQNTLTFNAGNWNSPQTVTVSAVDNQIKDGAHSGLITHTANSADARYTTSLAIASVAATITDNDSVGIVIVESGGSTNVSEATPATGDTYTVRLATQPTVTVSQVLDGYPGSTTSLAASSPGNGAVLGGFMYFSATDGVNGIELWRSDGTAAGTTLVKEINAGSGSSSPTLLTKVGTTLFFRATDGINGSELWKSDGTAAGTVMVRDISSGASSTTMSSFTALGTTLYFSAADARGTELWKSDGTYLGTKVVKDIYPGANSSFPANLTVNGATLYFSATDPTNGTELYKTDGTLPGTVLVKDIYTGITNSAPGSFAVMAGTLYFRATDSVNGAELYKSDGSALGTVLVKDINAGASSSTPQNLLAIGTTLYFSAFDANGTELWKSTGAVGNATLVKDIYAAASSSSPSNFRDLGGTLMFTAFDATGTELWKSTGTTGGTTQVKDIYAGASSSSISSPVVSGSLLYFTASDGISGTELWCSDGTTAGTIMPSDLIAGSGGSFPFNLVDLTGTLLFSSDGPNGIELRKSQGTAATTTLVKDINPITTVTPLSAFPGAGVVLNGIAYYSATDALNGTELWRSDGTPAGTFLVKDINTGIASSFPGSLTVINNRIYFRATTAANGAEFWVSDGTTAGTVLIKDIYVGVSSSTPSNFVGANGWIYFTAFTTTEGTELWRSDGTAAGTALFADIFPGASTSSVTNLTVVYNSNQGASEVYFSADDGSGSFGNELWIVDSFGGFPYVVADVQPGIGASFPSNFKVMNNVLYFTATGYAGSDLYYYDPIAGWAVVQDLPWTGLPSNLTVVGNQLFFRGTDAAGGGELWVTQGKFGPVTQVKDIIPGASSGFPSSLTAVNGQLFFTASDFTFGTELWKSDGTTAGTIMVKDINPVGSSFPSSLAAGGGFLYFAASDSSGVGSELWRSDGTAAGTILVKDIRSGTLSSSPGSFTALTPNTVLFSANDGITGTELWRISSSAVTATVSIADGQTVVDTDLVTAGNQNTLTFTSATWNTPQTVTAFAVDDTLYEANPHPGIITHAVASTGLEGDAAYNALSLPNVTASVADNEAAPTVQFTSSAQVLGEGSAAFILTVQQSALSALTTSIPFSLSGTATPGADYAISSSPLSIPAGSLSTSISISFNNDVLDEDDETIVVTLGVPTNGALGATTTNTTTITDNDGLPAVQFTSAAQSASEGAATITAVIQLSPVSGRAVTVPFTVTGTATSGTDYTITASPVVIAAGSTTANVVVTIINDTLDENNETVILTLNAPTNATIGGQSSTTLTITDNDNPPVVQFTSASQTASENIGTMTVTAQLSTPSGLPVTIPYSVSGSATLTMDFTISASPLVIAAGATTGGITITVVDDALNEADETVIVTMGVPTNATLGATAVHTATITDNDPLPSLEFLLSNQSLAESGGSMACTVQLSAVSGQDVTVPFTIGGTATGGGVDYTSNASPTIIPAGSTSVDINIFINNDALNEADETVVITLGVPTNATLGTVTTHTATILDDDPMPQVSFQLPTSVTVAESVGGVIVTAVLSAPSGQTVSVPVTGSGTAVSGTDYTVTGSFTFPAGSTMTSLTLSIVDDVLSEDDETIIGTLTAPVNAVLAPTDTVYTLTITDNDPLPTVQFAAASQSASENIGTMTVAAQLSAVSGRDVAVNFSLGGSASAGADYVSTASPLIIPAGSISAPITLTITDDTLNELNETIVVTMGMASNATPAGATVHTATILDNDAPPTVQFTSANQSAGEATGSMTVTAQLSAASGQTVTVPFTIGGTATGGGTDYSISASPITIPAGSTAGTATISIVDDALNEADETVIVTMGTPTNATLGATTQHTATITDNDGLPTVSFTSAAQSGTEAVGTMTVVAQLNVLSGQNVSVPFTLGGSASGAGVDYTITATPVTITAGSLSTNIVITVIDDALFEASEDVIVTMGAPTNATQGGTTVHTATITNNDGQPSVQFTALAQSGAENVGTITVTAQLSAVSGLATT